MKKTRQGEKIKIEGNLEFSVKNLRGLSSAVKNNVLCRARSSSRASFPGFPSYRAQGLLLSPPV